jgi:RecB family endonuclease NucS
LSDSGLAPALNEDWLAWAQAWQALDAGPLADALARTKRGEPVVLTLCGERTALTLAQQPRGWFRRLATAWRQPDVAGVLEAL